MQHLLQPTHRTPTSQLDDHKYCHPSLHRHSSLRGDSTNKLMLHTQSNFTPSSRMLSNVFTIHVVIAKVLQYTALYIVFYIRSYHLPYIQISLITWTRLTPIQKNFWAWWIRNKPQGAPFCIRAYSEIHLTRHGYMSTLWKRDCKQKLIIGYRVHGIASRYCR